MFFKKLQRLQTRAAAPAPAAPPRPAPTAMAALPFGRMAKPNAAAAPAVVVRDHRPAPVVRDHRPAPVVRDHRAAPAGANARANVAATPVTAVRPNPVAVIAPARILRMQPRVDPFLRDRLLERHLFDFGNTAAPGIARGQVKVPISPVPPPRDSVLFDDPADATRKYYLPRYRVRAQGSRYDFAVTTGPDGTSRVVLGLERFPATELGTNAQGAAELGHQVAVSLNYLAGPTHAIVKALAFTEAVADERGLTVSATIGLNERDMLLFALKTPAAAPRIAAQRSFRAAAPLSPPAAPKDAATNLRALSARSIAIGRPMTASVGRPAPYVPLRGTPAPTPAQPPAPRFSESDYVLEDAVDPESFVLDPQLHPYVYEGVGGADSAPAEPYRRLVLEHFKGTPQARFHAYLQDTSEPQIFYYLPDRFKLARRDTAPFFPEMLVRIGTPDDSVKNATVTIDYVLEPWSDEERLEDAEAALVEQVLASSREQPVELRPLHAKASMRLWVPNANAATLTEQPTAEIDLANGFQHSLTLPIDGFRQILAAAYSRDANSLFSGQVLVETGLSSPEVIPLEVRFADTCGELLTFSEHPSESEDAIAVSMRNGIESKLRFSSLPVTVQRGDAAVAGVVEGLTFDPPLELAPQAEVTFTVRLSAPLPGEGQLDAVFDLSDAEVLPEPDVILPLISDSTVPATYEREIEVMTMPDLLGDPNDPASILLVSVELKSGSVVERVKLTREQTSSVAMIHLPITDLLLERDTKGTYSFRQQVIRRNGTQTADADWRQADLGILVVPQV